MGVGGALTRAVRELHILGRRQWRMKAHYVLSHRPRCACVSLRKAPHFHNRARESFQDPLALLRGS